MDIQEIIKLVDKEIGKRPMVWYVDIPYLNGQFLERISVVTPKGKEALQIFKDMLDSTGVSE